MNKLNFGCGDRIADGWINMDFHASSARVRRWNLLEGFPYPDGHFDAVYSSHTLEHFTREQALFLLREARRVLKSTGVLRIVVPDLAGTCKEYLRILALSDDDPCKAGLYEWIVIELLDQLVRSRPGGEMGLFYQKLSQGNDKVMADYVRSRTDSGSWLPPARASFLERCRMLTPQRVFTKLTRLHLKCVGCLIPRHLRSLVYVETNLGERHRWMYDVYGLSRLCSEAGFVHCRSLAHNESAIPGFSEDGLDSNPDGSSYKKNSVYLEAKRE
ncbi:MAG: methyltransferase domain-containing protein [bacterium]